MNKKQFNKTRMYESVDVVLKNNAVQIQTIQAFPPEVLRFRNLVGAISIKVGEQSTAPAGKVEARDQAKEVLEKSLFVVMKGTKLLAQKNNDSELLALSTTSFSDIERLKDIELRDKAKSILEKANAAKDALVEFGITNEKLTGLSANIDGFIAAMEDLAGGETGRIAATTSLANLIKETDDALEKIDDLADILDDTYPEFGLQYKAARVIKDLGVTHKDKEENKTAGTTANVPAGTN
jgi:hypothetical protein